MSEVSGGTKWWECIHCHKQCPGIAPGTFRFCPFCAKSQAGDEKPHEEPPAEQSETKQLRLGAVQQHKAAPEEVGGGETTPSPHDKPAPQDNNQQTAPQVTDPTSEDIKRENSHTASQQQDPLGDGQSTSPDTKSIGDTQSPSGDSIDTLPQNPNPEQESALGMKSKHGIEQSDEEMPDPKRQKTDRQHPATSDASSSCSSASPKTPVMSTIPTQNNLGGDSSAGQPKPHEKPPAEPSETEQLQSKTVQQHKTAPEEVVEGQKSAGERSQAENPQASYHETKNKQDVSTNTQELPENSQPDLQEDKNKTSLTQTFKTTNVVSDLQSSGLPSAVTTTEPPHDKPAPQDNDQQTAPQVTDPASEDIKRKNSHTASQQQDPLGDGQPVKKKSSDVKSTGNTQAPKKDKDKTKPGMTTRSQSGATRNNTSTGRYSSATLPQNSNLKQKSSATNKEKHNPKQQKEFGQNPASDASSSRSSASPITPSTPIQETTPGGGSSAGQFQKKLEFDKQPTLFDGKGRDTISGRLTRATDQDGSNKESGHVPVDQNRNADVPGLTSPDKAINVTFHVLVPSAVWYWNEKSHIHLQFGHSKLGKWTDTFGTFNTTRNFGEGLYEMCCTLPFDIKVFQNDATVPYKYLLYSGRSKEDRKPHEWLHGAVSRGNHVVNRCLCIPKEKLQRGGYYNQYDNMVYPEAKAKTVVQRAGAFFSWVLHIGQGEEMTVPHHDLMQKECLHIYLETYHKILCQCELSAELNIIRVAEDVVGIFKQLFNQQICHQSQETWEARDLPEAMKEWLYSIVRALKEKQCATPKENGKRIAAVSSIIYCFYMLTPRPLVAKSIPADCLAGMMSMLTLQPDSEKEKCIDYEYMSSLILSPEMKKKVADAISHFCRELLHSKILQYPQWLYAIPLTHFLRGDCKPFQEPELNPEKMKWGDKHLGLTVVRSWTQDKNIRFIETHLERTRPLIAADPLFLQVLVYICPKMELQQLVLLIPPCVSASWISQTVQDSQYLNKKELEDVTEVLRTIAEVVTQMPGQSTTSPQQLDFTLSASFLLFSRLKGKLQGDSAVYTDALKAAVILTFCSLKNCISGNAESKMIAAKVKDTSCRLTQYLKDYIGSSKVTGLYFGGFRAVYAETELKLWNSLLQLDCPKELVEVWHGIVHSIVTERVAGIKSCSKKVDLFCILMESCGETHPKLLDIFMEATSQSFKTMMTEGKIEAVSSAEKLYMSKGDRERRGQLLGRVLLMQYPEGIKSISFEELLNWVLWPTFIRIYASEVQSKDTESCLPENCQLACAVAYSKLEEICNQICSGRITIKQLEKIHAKSKQMEQLCTEASSSTQAKFDFQRIKHSLDQRIKEYESFCTRKNHLHYLCSKVNVNVQGLQQLWNQLNVAYDDRNINTLCSSDGTGVLTFHCFESAAALHSIVADFHCMAHVHGNDLFSRFWKSQLNVVVRQANQLQIVDIVTLIWNPTFTKCKTLLDSLRSRTIQLCEVDEYFQQYQSNQSDQLKTLLTSLVKGVNTCLGQPEACTTWIEGVVCTIQEYWSLCKYATAATTFLELRRQLQLSGDFILVERLATKASDSIKDQTLGDVDESLVDTGKFLQEFVSDSEKLKCLQIFAECLSMVNWIRKETKDVGDLQNFVNVALATAAGGEGALACDKLSNLVKVGSGFGSLIYTLQQDASFIALADSCRSVWEAIKHTPSLPRLLLDCTKELDWFKAVKETQGSVERTTFGQMNNIINYGCYKVGSRKLQIFQSREEIVHVTLYERDKRLHKKAYTLEDLKDLESKLILITGSKAENRTEVDYFLDTLHSACRIADVLLALQQAGNVKYTGWVLSVPCQYATDVVAKLQEQAKIMEKELQTWENEVKHNREEFYELNYYTTPQLLSLRSELGKLKSPVHGIREVRPSVLALLHSISPEISAADFEVLQDVAAVSMRGIEDSKVDPVLLTSQMQITHSLAANTVDLATVQKTELETVATTDIDSVNMQASITSPRDAPQAKLTERDLNDRQKEIYANLVNHAKFPKQLVLIALEKYKEDEYDIREWCFEHCNDPEFSDEEELESYQESSEDESTSEESESEDTTSTIAAADKIPVMKVTEEAPISKATSSQISIKRRQQIDESHPDVHDLICEGGFDVDESIEAIEQFGNVSEAMGYLMSGGQEGLFESTREETSPEEEIVIYCDDTAETKYLSLQELGLALNRLSSRLPAAVSRKRTLPKLLKAGQPNLIVTSPENVIRTVLSLYMEDEDLPLPTYEEVLICYPSTKIEEVTLLWKRAIGDPDFNRIFCLVHAEKLSYQVCDNALWSLNEYSCGKLDYRLVMICSNEEIEKSHIISKLQLYSRQYTASTDIQKFQHYLRSHFTMEAEMTAETEQQYGAEMAASVVDCEDLCVRVVSSTRSGMGKSLFISQMVESQRLGDMDECVTIPIHGPVISSDIVLDFLVPHISSHCTSFHFDIARRVLWEVDRILFSLLILRGLSDSKGRVWRCYQSQLYAVEVTLPETQAQGAFPEDRTLALLELLPSVNCVSPKKALEVMKTESKDPDMILMNQKEFESATFQRVYQYLRRHIMRKNLDTFSYHNTVEGNLANCLETILQYCGISDPSWSEVRHFVQFLDLQLGSCEDSVFCDENLVGDVMAGLKSFVVKFMIRMSRDFATSSLCGEVARENEELDGDGEGDLKQYEIDQRRRWEQSSHPYIFFNQDRQSITFVGFMVKDCHLLDRTDTGIKRLERDIMTKQLYAGLKQNGVNFDENYQNWGEAVMIKKIGTVMGLKNIRNPDSSYVLTVDNLIKILAIQMRFRCGIPVVIMGETGCGKTRLIRYMCDLAKQLHDRKNMLIMKIHGGIMEKDIERFIEQAEQQAEENRQHSLDTVVFFDEANTTEAIGLIKEVMCDRRLNGRPVSHDLKFIAACNPYRKHTDDMIRKLESAGLGFHVRDTQQKLGQIPLRQLVYRVLDLPPSMRPLVYDFGQLNTGTESAYTRQIVTGHVKKNDGIPKAYIEPIANVLAYSQQYMRGRQDECSFVSLRDVERAMIVLEYFLDKMAIFNSPMDKMAEKAALENEEDPIASPNEVSRSLVLALSVCYHARLQEREEYEEEVAQQFIHPLQLPGGAEQFRNEIRWCQEVLLDNMTLGPNIARNAALRENIFMMTVCIELRIPLFLVGKPGSSKSLAKSIVASSMQGQASKSELLKEFKQVHIFSYQCSQLSTPESVIEVFNTAKSFQKDRDTSKYVSVVVLDEVGLAEDSPNLPLKALHPLLEDGTEGADDSQQVIDREKRVAFIGISNWALDPAKMNRGVMVTRGDPDVHELELSARGICSYVEKDLIKERLEGYFRPLAEAYVEICKKQKREFFGLRDFYSLIKMLYWLCEKSDRPGPPTWPQLEHAICRNFGGLDDQDFDPLEEFRDRMPHDLMHIPYDLHSVVNPDSSPLGLIKASLSTKETSWHGENRYLLFLTENYAALGILHHYLHDVVGPTSHTIASQEEEEEEGGVEKMDPFILFGSSFPKDKEYTQVCRNINQIKICMETGRTVILLNLDNLYESLYDVLNQYYIYHGDSRYVDLGLQTHRVKCRVHENFKLILIAEKSTVYEKFPTPLINRLEKHFVLTSSVLTDCQLEVLKRLQEWARQFSCVQGFTEKNAFIGYQKDTPAAVVFQATKELQSLMKMGGDPRKWEWLEQAGILQQDELVEEDENSEKWEEVVLQLSQYLLLQTASPDAFFRLKNTPLAEQQSVLWEIYNGAQHHSSLEEFLGHHLSQSGSCSLLLQVTTHSHLLSRKEVEDLGKHLGYEDHIKCFLLQEFDTELNFSNKVSPAFQRKLDDFQNILLIIQCDSGHLDGDLIACARYRIYDERAKSLMKNSNPGQAGSTHVLFVIHLPQQEIRSSFIGFQGDPWISSHIDDLRRTSNDSDILNKAMTKTMSSLFFFSDANESMPMESLAEDRFAKASMLSPERTADHIIGESMEQPASEKPNDEMLLQHYEPEGNAEAAEPMMESSTTQESDQVTCNEDAFLHWQSQPKALKKSGYFDQLHSCIQAAVLRLQEYTKNTERATELLKLLVDLIPRSPEVLDDATFHGVLVIRIHQLLTERDSIQEDKDWVLYEALSAKKLLSGGTFRNVIARKLDEVITPIFAKVIALLDHNCNLDLANPKKNDTSVTQFWLAMFRDPKVMCFSYAEMLVMEMVPVVGGRKAAEEVRCQFPFSWLVQEAFDAQWASAKSTTGNNRAQLYTQLHNLVLGTPIGGVLESVDEINCKPFYQCYLHDFVRRMHKCNHKMPEYTSKEYMLIEKVFDGLIHSSEDFSSTDGHESLTRKIAAVHVVYHTHQSHLLWFGQLTSHLPGVLVTLEQRLPTDSEEMLLHLYAVERALDMLNPLTPLKKDTLPSVLRDWLNRLELSRNTIDSILILPSKHEIARRARLRWQMIRVLQMFVEHIVLKHEGMEIYARRLEMYLREDPDFLKASTIDKVKKLLNSMDNYLEKRKFKDKPKKLVSIRNSCLAFFMELVSTLCFGGESPPEEELIQMLINTVFTERQQESESEDLETGDLGTREFNYRETVGDTIPVIRSFLLQMLLEHNTELVRAHLADYFMKSQQTMVAWETADRDLYLLYTQCFEDTLYKRCISQSFLERLTSATKFLKDGHDALTSSDLRDAPLEFLEGTAKVRYGLSVVAELLSKQISGVGTATQSASQHYHGVDATQLVHAAEVICTDKGINHIDVTGDSDTTGPIVYLLKLLMRRYGTDCLQQVSGRHEWVVPPELRQREEEIKTKDPFVLYGQSYSALRRDVTAATIGSKFEQLAEELKDLPPQQVPLLLLALYEKVTLSWANTLPSKQLQPKVLDDLNKVVTECTVLSMELQCVGRDLLANEQGGPLAQMRVTLGQSALHQTLGAIVVHVATIFQWRQRVDILKPFINMLNDPAALINTYLPTMPEDSLVEVRRAFSKTYRSELSGTFFECPRGHPYLVTECGTPTQVYNCNVCNSQIGGLHELLHDNRTARQDDLTQTGHCLGQPEGRTSIPTPERTLSPAACCIFRALMHSSLLWASCKNEAATDDLLRLVKPGLPNATELPEFFWHHLERDLQLLGQAIGKSVDEAAIVLHLVLREILTQEPPRDDAVRVASTLEDRNNRREWEMFFNRAYIQPVLEKVEENISKALDCIMEDDSQEQDQLFYLVYEKILVTKGSVSPHLWTYRSRVTLEHLSQTLDQQRKKSKCPILHYFLQQEHFLRATQYLPDIVRLQQHLYVSFHHRLDRREAKHITIGQFLGEIKNENVRGEYQGMVESLQKAWQLVGDQLRDHARLRVDEAHLLPAIIESTSLEYLIPTTTGAGACTTALVDFLVLVHNNFIERCRGIIAEQKSKPKIAWQSNPVPLPYIHDCHLLIYERQLPSVILSHCRYSLQMGKGQDVSYDWPALEKDILGRFIHGKPLIQNDIPQVVYRKDIYTAATFAAVRKKVEPQIKLDSRVQQEIVHELRSVDRIREALDVVDIVLGFLSSGGGRADRQLGEYITRALRMKKRFFSEKAREHCTLGHILSLWETLSVELARQLILSGQDPFDTVKDEFSKELTSEGEDSQTTALDRCLRSFNLDHLLGILYELIETHVKHCPDTESDWPLVDTLDAFLEQNNLTPIPHFADEFPNSITLAQTVAVWKHIVQLQERQKRDLV